jgi:hypothetical protein
MFRTGPLIVPEEVHLPGKNVAIFGIRARMNSLEYVRTIPSCSPSQIHSRARKSAMSNPQSS